jgi:POT family proton-dependent oligopeptide transporter
MVYVLSILSIPLFILLLNYYTIYSYIINPFGIVALIYVLYAASKLGRDGFLKIIAAMVLIIFSSLFWAFYEQGGGSLNLFADRNVNMNLLGIQLSSAGVNNSINSFLIVLLTPFFVWLWIFLNKRKTEPIAAIKFALALLQLGLGFYIFVIGANFSTGGMVGLLYFVLGYLFMTTGELCLSPIGLSAITKLSPPKMVGIMMGMWFLASSYGQYLAGLIGSLMAIPGEDAAGKPMAASESLLIYTDVFTKIAWVSAGCGVLLLLLSPWLKKMMGNIK